jgi:hypothetical protein
VRLGIEGGVLVHLDDPDVVVIEVVGDPVGLDQYVVCIIGHRSPLSLSPSLEIR